MHTVIRRFVLAAAASLAAALASPPHVCAARDSAPAWLTAVQDQACGSVTDDSKGVVLLDESIVTIGTNGRRTIRQRQVVRILKREGRDAAIARIPFAAKADKFSGFQAWLIKADGRTRTFGRNDIVELATSPDVLYADTRAAIIDASLEADAGSVFGWEGTLDELSTLGQGRAGLQGPMPVALARVVVRVPKGWRLDGRLRGCEPASPAVAGESYTWELRDLPGFVEEAYGPGWAGAAMHLVYDIRPPAPQAKLRTFATWADTSTYALELHTGPARPDAAIAARARELTANAANTWGKIHALGTYAQKLRYVAIAMNLGTGGGYTPHAASEVLHCGYGDCKDKTTLLRALLAAEDIRSWPVLCFSGDPTAVREDWPSPVQFNHVLTAIELGDTPVPDDTFVVEHPGIGRILLFDPTDPHTSVGDFPDYNQGGRVLVCTPQTQGLTVVPIAAPEKNHVRRRIKVGLEPNGAARVGAVEAFHGASAADMRRRFEDEAKLRENYEKLLRSVHPQAILSRADLSPGEARDRVTLRTGFGAPRFCRTIRDQLLVFAPVVRFEEPPGALPEGPRTHPIALPSTSLDESTEFLLPEGFRLSECGSELTLDTAFGRYELILTPGEGTLTLRRRRVLRGGIEPASNYEAIRAFFEAIRKAENTPIVLERVASS